MSSVKDQYTRKNIKSDMLKLVIFRFDISGLPNLKPFVDELCRSSFMKRAFKKMKRFFDPNQIRPFRRNISVNGTLPLSERVQREIYRFSDCSIGGTNSSAILDITPDNICLTINCNGAYEGSEKYTDFLIKVLDVLDKVNSFIYINRLGIRKIDSVEVKSLTELTSFFDDNYVVANDLMRFGGGLEATKTSIYFINNVHYNVVQHVEKKGENSFQMVLDVDAYTEEEDDDEPVDTDSKDLRNLMYVEMQDKMFEFFKDVASVDYLEKCKIGGT